MIGQLLGRYRIEEKIGEGGMGVVYRAEDTRLNRSVAIKIIHPDLLRDPDARARFVREAQAASALEHPNICTIHSIEEVDGQLFLVLEYLRGQTLKERTDLQTNTRLLLDCSVQTAEGLAEAHRTGIVHRDIKSTNILLTDRGLIKIMDFGLAKQIKQSATASSGATTEVTNPGVSVGTPSYMSPEQAFGRPVDARSDVFSLGVVLYEISTGRLPFAGNSAMEAMDAVLHREPAPPGRLNSAVLPEFERIVLKALRKEADERYTSAADMLVDLKTLRRDVDSGVRSGSAMAAAAAEHRPPAWKSILLVVVALLLLVGGTIGTVLVFTRNRRDAAPPAAAAAGRPALAVMNFENRTGDAHYDRYGLGVNELLSVELARGGGTMDLVSSQKVFDVLREMNKQMTTLDRSVATEVARRCAARYMARGEILKPADSVILKAEIVEVETGRLVSAQRVVDVDDKNLLDKIDELSKLMREDLKAVSK